MQGARYRTVDDAAGISSTSENPSRRSMRKFAHDSQLSCGAVSRVTCRTVLLTVLYDIVPESCDCGDFIDSVLERLPNRTHPLVEDP
jgi:hypothetical protein